MYLELKSKNQITTDLFVRQNEVSNVRVRSLLEAEINKGSANVFRGFKEPKKVSV